MKSETSETILIVDDAPENIELITSLIKNEYKVKIATSGARALKIVKQDIPDLILLDIMMPEMNGYEVLFWLKSDPATNGIPVIFLTAVTDLEGKTRGFEMGAVDYITKPFEPAEVQARVKTHIELAKARNALAEQNRQLIEAHEILEEMERISRHDMKNPLTIIINGPGILTEESNITEDQAEILRDIEQAGWRLLRMVNNTLDIYKMERGTYTLTPETVNLIPIIRAAEKDLSPIILGKGIGIEILINQAQTNGSATFPVWGEPSLCYTLFANLLKNAAEAAPEGSRITISLTKGDPAGIAMTNLGEVPEDIRDTFFDKYVTSEKEKGIGLGTYSAALFTTAQGGTIRLEPGVPGQTTINITLPVLPGKT